jgi:oxygen-dependent protoporphyrinogen oxidase
MPQYHVGHQARIQRIEAQLAKFPGLALAGNAYHGVGIADCVRTGEEAAEKIVHHVLV